MKKSLVRMVDFLCVTHSNKVLAAIVLYAAVALVSRHASNAKYRAMSYPVKLDTVAEATVVDAAVLTLPQDAWVPVGQLLDLVETDARLEKNYRDAIAEQRRHLRDLSVFRQMVMSYTYDTVRYGDREPCSENPLLVAGGYAIYGVNDFDIAYYGNVAPRDAAYICIVAIEKTSNGRHIVTLPPLPGRKVGSGVPLPVALAGN